MTHVEVLGRMQEASLARDWETLRNCFTEGFVNHASPSQGADGMAATVQAIAKNLDVTSHVVHDTVAEGDKVVQRVTLSGTHHGSTAPVLHQIRAESSSLPADSASSSSPLLSARGWG